MDESHLEMAERLENAAREHAVYQAAAKNAPEKHPDFDGQHCVECDNEIPEQRLQMKKVRCVYCQTTLEKHRAYTQGKA